MQLPVIAHESIARFPVLEYTAAVLSCIPLATSPNSPHLSWQRSKYNAPPSRGGALHVELQMIIMN